MDIVPYVTAQRDKAILAYSKLIELKRQEVKFSEIEDIRNVYRILFMLKLMLKNAIVELEDSM
jgi:acyl-[acyl carrier protein]--UDP-N-acetylglucosamine O-acyltransferase